MDQKNLVKFPDQVPPTLESLPTEVQLQICREMLRSEEPITLAPFKPYVSGFAFGSLGILRASKYFSTMALSIMYGENCFHLMAADSAIEIDHSKYNDWYNGQGTVCTNTLRHNPNTLRHNPWENLRNIPQTLFGKVVLSIDCLDMISQTSSGQTFLKHLQIDFGRVAWMGVMDGVLLRILKRMRGLQSVELNILFDWDVIISDKEDSSDDPFEATEIWHERNARDFLILVREELSHISRINMGQRAYDFFDDTTIIDWMADELEKRNEAWAPPLPSYKNFRRTLSTMSLMDAEVAKSVVEYDDEYRSKNYEQTPARLERLRGVF